jgi:dGTPase
LSDGPLDRIEIEEKEKLLLAPYAMHSAASRGRSYPEAEHSYRSCFQRDRDRVIHSAAFRRLKDKTQVFPNDEDDHFRTRLTHTMEVAQVSRTIARALRLNEDLAEAIALVHDLGHTPFGHAGEAALQECLKEQGGFNHNQQSLRVVEQLEDRYPDFHGLNLTYEVREGIVKHETDYDFAEPERFNPEEMATLEAQLVDLADEIAYNAHDVDDGYFSGLLDWDTLSQVPLAERLLATSKRDYPTLPGRKRHYHLVRLLINHFVTDVVATSAKRLCDLGIEQLEDVRSCSEKIISLSAQARSAARELKDFLFAHLYRHPRLLENNAQASRKVADLYETYLDNHQLLPLKHQHRFEAESASEVVRDYVAGMTDRFADTQHARLCASGTS